MGQCFSTNSFPVAPSGNLPPSYFEPAYNPTPSNLAPEGRFSRPAGPPPPQYAQPFATHQPGPRPARAASTQPARPSANRFLAVLQNNLDRYPEEQQNAIHRLANFDARKNSNIKNCELLSPRDRVDIAHYGNRQSKEAMQRTASFLLIKDILADAHHTNSSIIGHFNESRLYGDFGFSPPAEGVEASAYARTLLAAQVEAVKNQVDIGACRYQEKLASGVRIPTLTTKKEAFSAFLQTQHRSIQNLFHCCGMGADIRLPRVEAQLNQIAYEYLRRAGALPKGVNPGDSISMFRNDITGNLYGSPLPGTTLHQGQVLMVRISNIAGETSCVNFVSDHAGEACHIFISPEEDHGATSDPLTGGTEEQYYSQGFEHCNITRRQAAVFLQKLFGQLCDVENQVIESNVRKSESSHLVRAVEHSAMDRAYLGSEEVGDLHDERGAGPGNQRVQSIDTFARNLKRFANIHKACVNEHRDLLLDQKLVQWVESSDFEKDMKGLKHPEFRVWTHSEKCVAEALKKLPFFR